MRSDGEGGTMKIVGTVKKKPLHLKQIDLVLKGEEIDALINFLEDAKKFFAERRADASVKRVAEREGKFCVESVTEYSEIVKSKDTLLDCHMHYKDWLGKNGDGPDIVIHTTFEAKKRGEDSFSWEEERES